MPFKKRNKQQQKTCIKQNKIIKKRLMQISICVDNYIYKHKPITIKEAMMYVQEISLYKTQCTGDIHILQVIEKLTRCMKSIVEERTKNLTTNQNIIASEKGESIDMFLESPLDIHLKNTRITKNDENCYEILASKNIASENLKTSPVAFVASEGENKTNVANDATLNKEKQNYDLNKLITKGPTNGDSLDNNNLKSINCIMDPLITTNNVLDIENSNITITEKRPLEIFETPISLLNKDNLRSDCKDVPNTQQLKLHQAKTNISVTTQQKTKCDFKSTITLEKNQQISTTLLRHIGTQNNKQKNNISNSAQVKPTPKKKKCIAKKSCIKEKITNKSRKSKIIPENNKNNSKIPDKFKHTNVHIRNDDEMQSISACNENRSNKLTAQVDSPIYNKHAVNDLSWVDNIKYVREVSANEFDPKLNGLEDNFWNNYSLPESWSDIDIFY